MNREDCALVAFWPPASDAGDSSVGHNAARTNGRRDMASHRFHAVEQFSISNGSHESIPGKPVTSAYAVLKSVNRLLDILCLPSSAPREYKSAVSREGLGEFTPELKGKFPMKRA